MGDVYWMTAILIIQSVVSAVICAILAIRCESVVGEKKEDKKAEKNSASDSV